MFPASRRTSGGNELGPDHSDRGQPGHLHQDRFREQTCGRVPQHFVHFSRLQHLHEGQGSARRSLHHQPHLRHLRRQPRHLRHLRAEHGVRREAATDRRMDRESRRGCRVHVRSQHFSGQSGRRGLLRADGEGDQSQGLGESAIDAGAALQSARLPHHRRHHDRAQSLHRIVLPRGAGHEPHDAGNVLPDGRPPRASLHFVSRRRRHRAHDSTLYRLSRPPDEVRRVHEEGRPAA